MNFRKIQQAILFQDDHLIAINKPAGLLTIPDRYDPNKANLIDILREQHKEVYLVHRLDRDTSGCILFAKSKSAQQALSELFELRKIEKYYLAIVDGIPDPTSGSIATLLRLNPRKKLMEVGKDGKQSTTKFEVIESFKNYSLVRFLLITGRMHQIRIHSKYIGHPLAIDPLYGKRKELFLSSIKKDFRSKELKERPLMSRLSLHSYQLAFMHPFSNKRMEIECPLPKDFRAVLNQLRKYR